MEQDSQPDETPTPDEKPDISPEQSLELAKLSLELSQKAVDRCENHRNNDWKVSVTIWVTLFLCTYFLVGSGSKGVFLQTNPFYAAVRRVPPVLIFIFTALIPIGLHVFIRDWGRSKYYIADRKMSLTMQIQNIKYMKLVDPSFHSANFELLDVEDPSVTHSSG